MQIMIGPENNPSFRNRNPDNDITFDVKGETYKISDLTFIKAGGEFLSLCKMCKKSPMTCDNTSIREVALPMEPGDDPELEIKGNKRLPSGEMSELMGLGFKLVDGIEAGIYKTEEYLPSVFVCEMFDPKDSG